LDRLDRLTEHFVADLDRQADSPAAGCLAIDVLGDRLTGRLGPAARERVDAHLDECLTCLHAFTELRDYVQGIATPGPVSPGLARTLDGLLGHEPRERVWLRVASGLRRALVLRVPAWTAAATVAGLLLTWVAVQKLERPNSAIAPPATTSERLTPAYAQNARTISGVVGSIRDATSNGVDAHVISVTDAAGATYVLFAWGRPTIRAGESVEVVGIFTSTGQSAGSPVYQGVATALRRAR